MRTSNNLQSISDSVEVGERLKQKGRGVGGGWRFSVCFLIQQSYSIVWLASIFGSAS